MATHWRSRDCTGRVTIRTYDGDTDTEDLADRIRLSSMDGEITIDGAIGDIELRHRGRWRRR